MSRADKVFSPAGVYFRQVLFYVGIEYDNGSDGILTKWCFHCLGICVLSTTLFSNFISKLPMTL